MEALLLRVPLIALPVFADQPATAAAIARAGIGACCPLAHLSSHTLRDAVLAVAAEKSPCRTAVERVAERMRSEGGAAAAMQILLGAMQRQARPAPGA